MPGVCLNRSELGIPDYRGKHCGVGPINEPLEELWFSGARENTAMELIAPGFPNLMFRRLPVCGREINLPEMRGGICEFDRDRTARFVLFANANNPN